jgi:hypothetical protein
MSAIMACKVVELKAKQEREALMLRLAEDWARQKNEQEAKQLSRESDARWSLLEPMDFAMHRPVLVSVKSEQTCPRHVSTGTHSMACMQAKQAAQTTENHSGMSAMAAAQLVQAPKAPAPQAKQAAKTIKKSKATMKGKDKLEGKAKTEAKKLETAKQKEKVQEDKDVMNFLKQEAKNDAAAARTAKAKVGSRATTEKSKLRISNWQHSIQTKRQGANGFGLWRQVCEGTMAQLMPCNVRRMTLHVWRVPSLPHVVSLLEEKLCMGFVVCSCLVSSSILYMSRRMY